MIGFTPDILDRGRALARTRMRATVIVRRAGEPVKNTTTGKLEPTWTTIYDGPAELRIRDSRPREVDGAGQRYAEQAPEVAYPIDGEHAAAAAQIRVDDVGEVLTDPDNPANVGATFRTAGLHLKSLATARRLPVEVLSFA